MIKLGLALGGGGARGSYQLGVIKALTEEGLLNTLKVVSGTSIGSFNACLVMEKMDYDQMYDVWETIDNTILYKESFDRFKNSRLGMFDQEKMYSILIEKSNANKVVNSPIIGYAAACKIGKNGILSQVLRSHMEPVLLKLNESENPHLLVLASSSIPLLFGATLVNDEYYVDGGMLNNLPINALEEEGCNLKIVIGLNKNAITSNDVEDTLVIDFSPKTNISVTPIGILDFSKENLIQRTKFGYDTAKELISRLKEDGIINESGWSLTKMGLYK